MWTSMNIVLINNNNNKIIEIGTACEGNLRSHNHMWCVWRSEINNFTATPLRWMVILQTVRGKKFSSARLVLYSHLFNLAQVMFTTLNHFVCVMLWDERNASHRCVSSSCHSRPWRRVGKGIKEQFYWIWHSQFHLVNTLEYLWQSFYKAGTLRTCREYVILRVIHRSEHPSVRGELNFPSNYFQLHHFSWHFLSSLPDRFCSVIHFPAPVYLLQENRNSAKFIFFRF